jgi:hypothetical protein
MTIKPIYTLEVALWLAPPCGCPYVYDHQHCRPEGKRSVFIFLHSNTL